MVRALSAASSRMMKCRNRASRFESCGRLRFGSDLVRKASSRGMRRPCAAARADGGRVNRYYDPTTGEFITVDPLYGGTSNPRQSGPGSGSGSQPVSIYQLVLGLPTSIQFNGGDPAAGLPSNSGDTTGAVAYPSAFGLSDVGLASLSSLAGLPETNPSPPNPSYVGAGFFSPDFVSSSGSPYAYVGGDPIDGVDPGGEFHVPGLHEALSIYNGVNNALNRFVGNPIVSGAQQLWDSFRSTFTNEAFPGYRGLADWVNQMYGEAEYYIESDGGPVAEEIGVDILIIIIYELDNG